MWCFMPEGHSLASIETCVSASILCSPHLLCVKRSVCAHHHRTQHLPTIAQIAGIQDLLIPPTYLTLHLHQNAHAQVTMISGRMRINHGIYSIHNLIFHLPGLRHAMYPRMDSKQYVRCIPLLTLVNYSDLSETMNRPCDGWRCYVKREVGEFKKGEFRRILKLFNLTS